MHNVTIIHVHVHGVDLNVWFCLSNLLVDSSVETSMVIEKGTSIAIILSLNEYPIQIHVAFTCTYMHCNQ